MTTNDLLALLAEAAEVVGWAANHWPAHKALADRITIALAQPAEEVPLREENLALRAALRVQQSNAEWRLLYIEAERARRDAEAKVARFRDALDGVVGSCRFNCDAESNCGVCSIALRAVRGET